MEHRSCVKKVDAVFIYRFSSLKTDPRKSVPFTYKSNFYPLIVPVKIIYFLP